VFRVICHVLAYSNSCVNPFIYHYVSADFRRSLAAVLALLCRRRGRLGRAATSSAIAGIELGTIPPVESGFIAGAPTGLGASVDYHGTVSLVDVHGTEPQVRVDTSSPDENGKCDESTGSKLRVGRPSYSV